MRFLCKKKLFLFIRKRLSIVGTGYFRIAAKIPWSDNSACHLRYSTKSIHSNQRGTQFIHI
jgi:hypothetical protein